MTAATKHILPAQDEPGAAERIFAALEKHPSAPNIFLVLDGKRARQGTSLPSKERGQNEIPTSHSVSGR